MKVKVVTESASRDREEHLVECDEVSSIRNQGGWGSGCSHEVLATAPDAVRCYVGNRLVALFPWHRVLSVVVVGNDAVERAE